jgi:hypothetical protein
MRDEKGLARLIRWSSDGAEVVFHDHDAEVLGRDDLLKHTIASKSQSPEMLARFQRDELLEPALTVVERFIADGLEDLVQPCPRRQGELNRIPLDIVPRSLLGALWLQAAQMVDGNFTYQRCEGCGHWFEIKPPATRRTKQFCTASCRVRAHRQRKAEAEQIARAAKKPGQRRKQTKRRK